MGDLRFSLTRQSSGVSKFVDMLMGELAPWRCGLRSIYITDSVSELIDKKRCTRSGPEDYTHVSFTSWCVAKCAFRSVISALGYIVSKLLIRKMTHLDSHL